MILPVVLFFIYAMPAPGSPSLSEVDRIRLAEAFRLADQLNGKFWKEWSESPFSVLLITAEQEFLIRHPQPSKDFIALGNDKLLGGEVFYRARTQPLHLLATFPVAGPVPTVVIGQAENTSSKTSTPWVITLLHEHFHQLQMSQPLYYKDVESLDLSGGDKTGMWMLNYPFPYEDPEVRKAFKHLAVILHDALLKPDNGKNYFLQRSGLKSHLNEKDYKYYSFQLWQEGISRYTEFKVADWAAKEYKPSPRFLALTDYVDFGTVARHIYEDKILNKLKNADLAKDQRELFYALGAAEGLLLDLMNPGWQDKYLTDKFFLENYQK